jgi:hypothetical protein
VTGSGQTEPSDAVIASDRKSAHSGLCPRQPRNMHLHWTASRVGRDLVCTRATPVPRQGPKLMHLTQAAPEPSRAGRPRYTAFQSDPGMVLKQTPFPGSTWNLEPAQEENRGTGSRRRTVALLGLGAVGARAARVGSARRRAETPAAPPRTPPSSAPTIFSRIGSASIVQPRCSGRR